MRALIRRWTRLAPVLNDRRCDCCGTWYDPSDPAASYPHNNH
ncbi:hypothetical protein [Nocardiopsis sp. CNT312]|nr:hypothetical protein [Nocardiopsis sp. CNT312]